MQTKVNLDLTFQYKEGYSGILVGQCVEYPSLIVQGKTFEELKEKMMKVISAYFGKFPDEKKRILGLHGKIVDTNSWNKEQLVCKID
jgi:hypothetical protein